MKHYYISKVINKNVNIKCDIVPALRPGEGAPHIISLYPFLKEGLLKAYIIGLQAEFR